MKYIQGDEIKYKELEWVVLHVSETRYNLVCTCTPSQGQLSAKIWKVDKDAEVIKLAPRKKISNSSKESEPTTRKEKWWKFW